MDVTCRRCFRAIPPGAIDASLGFVECPFCDAVFELPAAGAAAPPPRPEVPMPRGVTVAHRPDDALELAVPFPRWKGVIAAIGAAGMVAVAVVLGVYVDDPGAGKTVGVAVALVNGLLLGYFGAAFLANVRRIVVDRDAIAVRVGPVRWPGERRIRASALKQLYVMKVTRRSSEGTHHTTFHVRTIDDDGDHRTLLVLDRGDQALWLEQQIERHLGITDVPVIPPAA